MGDLLPIRVPGRRLLLLPREARLQLEIHGPSQGSEYRPCSQEDSDGPGELRRLTSEKAKETGQRCERRGSFTGKFF